MRKMAQIVTVKEVFPIEGKDRIQRAVFNEIGYQAIISKEIQVGQKVIWIEADSILPVKPQWEFLRARCYKKELDGFLIKPMTMSKVKSWGLVSTIEAAGVDIKEKEFNPEDDITELLGIKKYEPVEDASPRPKEDNSGLPFFVKFLFKYSLTRWLGRIIRNKLKEADAKHKGFPEYLISKSDEDVLQNHVDYLEKYKDKPVYVTAKMEGQSVTACFDYNKKNKKIGKFFVCSRNIAYRTKINNTYWNFAIKNDIENKLREYYKKTGKLLCIQAEQCGPGIQQNIYNFKTIKWFVYSIKDEITGKQLPFLDVINVCNELHLNVVPWIVDSKRLDSVMPDLDSAVKYAEKCCFIIVKSDNEDGFNLIQIVLKNEQVGKVKLWDDIFLNEGIVVRSDDYDKDNNVGFSFKVKNIGYAEKGLGKISEAVRKYINKGIIKK